MGFLTSAATVLFLCACGTGLTLYAVHVQRSRLDDASYRALCDLDDTITCSQILAEDRDFQEMLEWVFSRVGVPYNANLNPHQPAFRISFFPLLCFLGCLPLTFSYFLATFLSSVGSMVAAYLLYMQFQVHDQICLPCTAICLLHVLLFLVLTIRWAQSGSTDTSGKGSPHSSSKQTNNRSGKQRGESDKERSSSDEASGKEQKMETGAKGKNLSKKGLQKRK